MATTKSGESVDLQKLLKMQKELESKQEQAAELDNEIEELRETIAVQYEKHLKASGIAVDTTAKSPRSKKSEGVNQRQWFLTTLAGGKAFTREQLKRDFPGKRIRIDAYIANGLLREVKGKISLNPLAE